MPLKKRLVFALAVIAFCVFVGGFVWKLNARVSRYQGKTVKTWLLQFSERDPNGRREAEAAFKALGTNAVPELVRLLRADDARWRTLVWTHATRMPMWLRKPVLRQVGPLKGYLLRPAAARALASLGPVAAAAEPDLVQALQDKVNGTYWEAGTALGRIGQRSVPDLVVALRDPDTLVRCSAAYGLGEVGPDATAAVPGLLQMQRQGNANEQYIASRSLAKIGASPP